MFKIKINIKTQPKTKNTCLRKWLELKLGLNEDEEIFTTIIV